MVKRRTLKVHCECGQLLAHYSKSGQGRLRKMWFERILKDPLNIFLTEPLKVLNEDILCPKCQKRVATVQIIGGKYAAKMNQGTVRE
jgi:hypothetical protein